MAIIPGTQVKLQFFTFASHYPPLYEPAGQGSLNLASINAGNSDGLCVGLEGVNGGFYSDLTQHANQQRVNLSPNQSCQPGNYDDYQDRHLKLIAQAAGGTASATYTNTDPCAFSYVNAKLVTQAPGYYEGAAFVDIFDPALRPYGNAKNVAMLYLAPPYDGNHASQADFLQAIEATAEKIIETVAGYNTLAAQQNLPVIEALRNTLFSSNIYNQRWSVKADLIAGAILAGFTTALRKNTVPGLVELQFPVGPATEPLFASLQSGTAAASAAPPFTVLGLTGSKEVREDDNDDADAVELPEIDAANADSNKIKVAAADLATALQPVRAAADALDQILASQGPPQVADPNYAAIPKFKNPYEAPDSPMSATAPFNFPPPALTPVAEACRQAGLRAVQAGNEIVQANGDFQKIATARTNLETAVSDAEAQSKLAEVAYSQYRSPGNKRSAEHAQEVAEAARKIRDAVPKIIRKGNRAELAKKMGSGAKIALIFTGILGAGAIVTSATLGCLIGTRSNYKPNGKKKEIALGESTATITLGDDPAPPEGLTVSAAFLLDPSTKSKVPTFKGTDGTWNVTKPTEITYTVTNRNKATIQYVLEFSNSLSGLAPHYSEPADIEITFVAAMPPPPEDPKDITVLATDRTSTVNIPVPTGSTLATGTEAAWTISTANGKTSIVFTPNNPTSVTKRAVYLLNSKMATIVVLLPVTPIPAQNAVPRVNPPSIRIFDAANEPGVGLTLLDAAGKPQQSIFKDGVTWSVSGTDSISIVTTALQDSTASVSISYALKFSDKFTPAATLTLNFAPAATPVDVSIVTADRSKVRCPLPGVPILGTTTLPLGGSWTTDGTASATYNFPNPPPIDEITTSVLYSLKPGGEQKKLTLKILPAPQNRTLGGRSRSTPVAYPPFDVANTDGVIWLLDGTNRVASLPATAPNSDATWSVDQVMKPREIRLTPGAKLTGNAVSVDWVLVASDPLLGETVSAKATLTIDLSMLALVAFSIPSPANLSRFKTVSIPVLDHCVVANGYQSIKAKNRTFGATDSPATGIWNLTTDSNGNPVVTVDASQALGSGVTLDYSIVDKTGAESNTATIAVNFSAMDRYRPRAADCAVSTVPGLGVTIAVDVLKAGVSYFEKDPTSVKLLGVVDTGMDNAVSYAAVAKDGKSLGSPGQGTWIVDSNGLIVYQTDPKLQVPVAPAPVWYQFADKLGNVSTPGKVIIDPATAQLSQLPAKMKGLDETAFWSAYQTNVSGAMPMLTSDEFIVITATLAEVTLLCGAGGPNPVSPEDYDAAYKAWYDAGEAWDDSPGSVTSTGLVAICEQLVNKALGPSPSLPYASRYWRLELMARMAEKDAGFPG